MWGPCCPGRDALLCTLCLTSALEPEPAKQLLLCLSQLAPTAPPLQSPSPNGGDPPCPLTSILHSPGLWPLVSMFEPPASLVWTMFCGCLEVMEQHYSQVGLGLGCLVLWKPTAHAQGLSLGSKGWYDPVGTQQGKLLWTSSKTLGITRNEAGLVWTHGLRQKKT